MPVGQRQREDISGSMEIKNTIRQAIVLQTENKGWEYAGIIAREIGMMLSKKESNIERRLREMAEDGILERRLVKVDGKGANVVQYRYVGIKLPDGTIRIADTQPRLTI